MPMPKGLSSQRSWQLRTVTHPRQCLRPCIPATRQCTRLLVSGARTSWSCLRSSFSESSRGLPQAFLSAFLSAGS